MIKHKVSLILVKPNQFLKSLVVLQIFRESCESYVRSYSKQVATDALKICIRNTVHLVLK